MPHLTPGLGYPGGFVTYVVVMICVIFLAALRRWHLGREMSEETVYGVAGSVQGVQVYFIKFQQ